MGRLGMEDCWGRTEVASPAVGASLVVCGWWDRVVGYGRLLGTD